MGLAAFGPDRAIPTVSPCYNCVVNGRSWPICSCWHKRRMNTIPNWKEHSFTSTQVPGTHPISRFAGVWSFFYVTLSNYLRIPLAPAEEQEHTSQQASLPTASEAGPAVATYTVTLFRKPRLLVKGTKTVEVPLTLRQQEDLAYLGTVAREKKCSRDDLIAAIHEKRDEQRKVNSHRDALDYDVRVLRRSVEAACQQAEVPYCDPVEVTGRGPGAFYRLASAYEVTDLAQFERMVERIAQLKRDPQAGQDVQEVRNSYESVLASYGEGFVGQQIQKEQIGSWARVSYRQYRSQYHELLWNVAEYEYVRSQVQQGEEKNASLRQAAKLYEQCAQLTAPTREELQQGNAAPLSEHALRQCLTVYGLLIDLSLVQLTYYHYLKTMQRRYRAWLPEPQTVRVFETAMGTSQQETTTLLEPRRRYGVRLSGTCFLSASTHRLVAYSPVRIPFRRSGRYAISEKSTVQPSPVGDCASKPIRRFSTLPSVKYRTIFQYTPSSEEWKPKAASILATRR